MIAWVRFRDAVPIGNTGKTAYEFTAADGWAIEVAEAPPGVRLSRVANPPQNIEAVEAYELRGYAFAFGRAPKPAEEPKRGKR